MSDLTMFTFGYWGWGSSTKVLLDVSAEVEKARGFGPPVFVDLRIQRNVRAHGFCNDAFEKLAGSRYVWMKGLGNRAVRDKAPGIVIDAPADAGKLLDLVLDRADKKRRIIAFCACEVPGPPKAPRCHRRTVANLVLAEAQRQRIKLNAAEWPGGKPLKRKVDVTAKEFRGFAEGGAFKPDWSRAEIASMPWGSRVTAKAEGQTLTFLTGAAAPRAGRLVLPLRAWGWDDWDEGYDQAIRAFGFNT